MGEYRALSISRFPEESLIRWIEVRLEEGVVDVRYQRHEK